MPSFRFHNSSVVAVGTFNIYVLQPENLARMNAIRSEKKVLVMGDLSAPGVRIVDGDVNWIIRPDRVSIESNNPSSNCGEKLARVTDSLIWTPIVAIGMNVTFRGELSVDVVGDLELHQIDRAVQCTCHAAFVFQGGLLNVQLSRTTEHQELTLNAHFDISKGQNAPEKIGELVVKRCDEFLSIRQDMVEFARSLTNIEFNYAEHLTS